jgi:hypothetical protein
MRALGAPVWLLCNSRAANALTDHAGPAWQSSAQSRPREEADQNGTLAYLAVKFVGDGSCLD